MEKNLGLFETSKELAKIVSYLKLSTKKNVFLRGQTHKLVNKLMLDGKKNVIKNIVYKSFVQIKKETHENPKYILLKTFDLLQQEVGFLKFYTRKQSRMKRRKKARYVPIPLSSHKQKIISMSLITKFILYQKRKRRLHNYKNQVRPLKKKMSSLSKKKIFGDRFYVSQKDQNLKNLIQTKFINWHTTNFSELIKFRFKFFAKATNRRTFMYFRWK